MPDNENYAVIKEQLLHLRQDVANVRAKVDDLAGEQVQIVRLQEQMISHSSAIGRAFKDMKEIDNRVVTLEAQSPINALISRWVILGVLGSLAIVGSTAFAVVFQQKEQGKKDQQIRIVIDREGNVKGDKPGEINR